jgi:UDP-N-acetyl-alpha-D-muramoyl-L-alanyl-L-glutamate epimerase
VAVAWAGPTAGPPSRMPSSDRFRYDGFDIDPVHSVVTCRYSTAGHTFAERFTFGRGGDWADPAVEAAVRLLYLLAGVSYYKTSAPPLIDLGDLPTTVRERDFLRRYYLNGLAEFAYRNDLRLDDLRLEGPDAPAAPAAAFAPVPGRPLIPFGGGIDSIVTVESVTADHPDAALCVVEPPGSRFPAIEGAAAVTGLPVARIERALDPLVRGAAEPGFLNGHVPVTAIITAAAVVAAVLEGRDAVVLSNEWSASVPTVVTGEVAVNHQWSKGDEFEGAFGDLVQATLGPGMSVFSYLRPRSELWVAQRFAHLTQYHHVFRSCNRAFHQDPAERLPHWCGRCDKCCFIDLVLAPFMDRAELQAVFDGAEPLQDPANEDRFRALLALGAAPKPFECVGDTDECRAAWQLAARRADRAGAGLVARLGAELTETTADPGALLRPRGPHRIPERYAPPDLLVRAR